jgi:hypothetical protein
MRPILRFVLAAVLGATIASLVACGDSNGLLSSRSAQGIERQLDSAAAAIDAGDCAAATRAAAAALERVNALPARVDPRLRERLLEGATRLQGLAARDCREQNTSTETLPTEPEPTSPTSTEEPTTPTTSTQETTPTEPSTPTSPPETAPSDGTGGDQGPGGGQE